MGGDGEIKRKKWYKK